MGYVGYELFDSWMCLPHLVKKRVWPEGLKSGLDEVSPIMLGYGEKSNVPIIADRVF